MGTRKSRHNRGVKPVYKDKFQRAIRAFKRQQGGGELGAQLDDRADAILRAAGNPELMVSRTLMPEIFDPHNVYDGIRMRGIPNPTIYAPTGDTRQTKTIGRPCAKCGKPVSKHSDHEGAVCRSCYGANAVLRQEQRIQNKWRRMDAHVNRYAWLVYITAQAWTTFRGLSAASEHDFAPALIEAIDRREHELQTPFVRWPKEEYGELLNQAFA